MYLECPREYWFAYVRYPERRKTEDNDVFRLGRAYHNAIEGLYRNRPLAQVLNEYKIETDEVSGYMKDHKDNLLSAIAYYQSEVYPLYDGLVKEVELDVKDFEIEGVDVPIHLRLDLATMDDRIVDHKTVGWRGPKAKGNKQMLMYSYYYLKKYGKLPRKMEIHSAYKNPKGPALVEVDSADVSYEDVLKVADLVRNVYKMIKAEMFPCFLGPRCVNSPYREEWNNMIVRDIY